MGLLRTATGLLLAAGLVIGNVDNTTKCCNTLKNLYADLTLLPDDTAYTEANQRWSKTAELTPDCIFRPTSAEFVTHFINIATNASCPFAIKSGGRNPWFGVNNIDKGIVVDLSNLSGTALSYDRTFVKLGPGAKWGDVYKTLEPQGMMVPGARAAGVGVGGMILGGGLSYFAPRVGLTADNVVNFEVVLADGNVVDANTQTNSDLFYALKGGTSNFGIVTRIDVKAFQNGKIWGGEIVSSMDSEEDALYHLGEFVTNSNEDVSAAVEVVFSFNASGQDRIISIVADTAGKSNSILLKPFKDLPNIADTTRMTSMSDLSTELQSRLPAGQRYLFATVTFVNDPKTLTKVHNLSQTTFADYDNRIPNVTWQVVYEPVPRYYKNFGGNPIGLNYSLHDRIAVVLNPTWLDAEYDGQVAAAANVWVDLINSYTNPAGTSSPLELLPYSAPFQDPLGYYGASNLQFLKDVAKKYDPDGFFQKLAPGDFRVDHAGEGHSSR